MATPQGSYQQRMNEFNRRFGTSRVSVELEGVDEWERLCDDYLRSIEHSVPDAVRGAVQLYKAECLKHVPRDRNTLATDITTLVFEQGGKIIGAVGSNVKQALFTEYGTRHIDVGTPESPRTDWPAKHTGSPGVHEWMPWLRSSFLKVEAKVMILLHRAGALEQGTERGFDASGGA